MRTDAFLGTRLGLVAVLLLAASMLMACGGGGGGTVNMENRPAMTNTPSADVVKGTGVLITEDEIATLPAWQQEKLSDPGWNQPYIEQRPKTEIEPPTAEMLFEDYNRVMAEGLSYGLHGASGSKGVSYMEPGAMLPDESVMQGEFNLSPRDVTPPYGCNEDGDNGSETHAFDDVIYFGNKNLAMTRSYVLEAHSSVNWFNATGGSGNDALSAVYQIFSTSREADPHTWMEEDNTAEFEELCYRADLAPGVAPEGDCSAATAYLVTELFWKKFNTVMNALPNLDETEWFNILIAPSSERSALLSSAGADARYQEFYFGNISDCFANSMIVGLEAATSGCDTFNESVTGAYDAEEPYHYTPIYGVLLERWQQAELAGMAGPWESYLGWPVWGPKAYANGGQMLTPSGAYYAWGLWFERGYMWWIDYDQTAYPNTPDEAQVFVWTGTNVFCPDETGAGYEELAPTVYYGGAGELGVTVVVDSYRYAAEDDWMPAELEENGTYYEVSLPVVETNPSGTGTVNVAMHAHAYGGVPNPDCSYDYYVWAFRDGYIAMGDEATSQYVTHTYGSTIRNMEQTYVVRVQVTDADGNLGYGDSLPIHLGHGGGGGTGPAEIWIIRNDDETYSANYDALTADLDELGASWGVHDYESDIADQFDDDGTAIVAIWFRGGPGDTTEQGSGDWTKAWTAEETDNYRQLLSDGHKVLLMSQSSGYTKGDFFPSSYASGWEVWWGYTLLTSVHPPGDQRHMEAHGMTGGKGFGGTGLYGYLASEVFGMRTVGAYGARARATAMTTTAARRRSATTAVVRRATLRSPTTSRATATAACRFAGLVSTVRS